MTAGASRTTLFQAIGTINDQIGQIQGIISSVQNSNDLVTSTEYLNDVPEHDLQFQQQYSLELPPNYQEIQKKLASMIQRLEDPLNQLRDIQTGLKRLKTIVGDHGSLNKDAVALQSRLTSAITRTDAQAIRGIEIEVKALELKYPLDAPTEKMIQGMLTQIGQVLAPARQPEVEEKEEKDAPPASPQLAPATQPSAPSIAFSPLQLVDSVADEVLDLQLLPSYDLPQTPPDSDDEAYEPVIPRIGVITIPMSEGIRPVIENMQTLVFLLGQKNEEGFLKAVSFIQDSGLNQKPLDAFDKIAELLYHIHRVESPSKLDGSLDYGTRAFQTEQASPEEKLRAAQRVLLFSLFAGIEEALREHDQASIRQYLGILGKLNLDPKDLPEGKKNLEHYLYEKLYKIYKAEAEKSGSGLRHPHDPAYKNEFGRHAFRLDVDPSAAIDRKFLQAAVEQVGKEIVRDVWQIPEL